MSIKKTNNGSYRLRVYIPDEVQGKLGLGRRYEKRFKTRREAKEAEIKLAIDIENARSGKTPTLSNSTFNRYISSNNLPPFPIVNSQTTPQPLSSTIPFSLIYYDSHNLLSLLTITSPHHKIKFPTKPPPPSRNIRNHHSHPLYTPFLIVSSQTTSTITK